jgi:predicted methyltransferase
MSFWELIRSQDSTLSEMTRAIGLMLNKNQIIFDSEKRKFSFRNLPAILPEDDGLCQTCWGKGVTLNSRFEQALDHFLKITTDRPPPIIEYNQGIIDPRDLALKSAIMYDRGDLEGRSILLLGDDDLFSIFLALLGLSCTVTVLEIDDRIISYINGKAKSNKLTVKPQRYDVDSPFPRNLRETFDAFVTEPPEGLEGMLLFLGRAIDALGDGGAGYFGLTTLESSLSKWLAIQKFLLGREMVITDLLRNFSLYPEAGDPVDDYEKFPISKEFPVAPGPPDVDYFRSSLVRIEKAGPATMKENQGIYTDEDTWVTADPGAK